MNRHASTHSRALSVASTAAAARQSVSQPVSKPPSHPARPPTFRALALSIAANQVAGAHLAAGSTTVVVLQNVDLAAIGGISVAVGAAPGAACTWARGRQATHGLVSLVAVVGINACSVIAEWATGVCVRVRMSETSRRGLGWSVWRHGMEGGNSATC